MLRISKKSEYAIIALKYIHTQPKLCTAREIAEKFKIPMEIMAKILQTLAHAGFVRSVKGARGGYSLILKPSDISIGDIVEILDGPIGIVECAIESDCSCPQYNLGICNIDSAFLKIQKKFRQFLKDITLLELEESQPQVTPPSTIHQM